MKSPNFTLRQLSYFVAAAKYGKIASASAEIGISQSAVTTAIRDLEANLGMPLLERHTHGVTLTHRGHLFHQHALKVLEAADEAWRWPFQASLNLSGRLNIVATHVVVGYFILPYIQKFLSSHPNVDISLRELTRLECEEALITGSADLGVMLTSNLTRSEDLETHTLDTAQRRVWVSARSPLASNQTVSLSHLQELPYVFLMIDEGERVLRESVRPYGFEPNVVLRTTSMEALREWIGLDLGVTIVADTVYRPWSLEGLKIGRLRIEEPIPPLEIGLAWKRDMEMKELAQSFAGFLRQTVTRGDSGI
ncbi:LysR family transcriptional regulator [Rhodobacteraceae bacterium W635]|uniref:LysR family transcriptional regulator n=1 Tax=Nioella halotolerans TaxID=2303578 RepID=UPI000E3B78E9|nr:LysR family transcriptional regulator [Rhodobacteraceae bacterium W635]